ncbi:MAG: hypothetical protein U0232_18750 [Thermomicrobiales bacterium]
MASEIRDRAGLSAPIPGPTAVAALLAPLGIIVASLAIPAGVDELPDTEEKVARILDIVAAHPFGTRLGFLSFAVGMLLLLAAMAALRTVAEREPRGRTLTQLGTWLIAVAAGALAIGNSFAPASEPSAVQPGLPRDVMIQYMHYHLLNGWAWAIIAFYPLLPLGAILLGIGLWRSRVLGRVATLLIAVPLAALIALPLSLPTLPLGLALELGLVLALRQEWPRRR